MQTNKTKVRSARFLATLIVLSLVGFGLSEQYNSSVIAKSKIIKCEESSENKEIRIDLDCGEGSSTNKQSQLEVSNKTSKKKTVSYDTKSEQLIPLGKQKPVEVVLDKDERKVINLPKDVKEVNIEVKEQEENSN